MVEKILSGQVLDEEGNVIGNISGTYIDEYQDSAIEQIRSRTINISVVDENGNSIGSGQLQYDDYIAINGGGTRTISLSGDVKDEEGNVIGSISGRLNDQYGSTLVQILMQWLPWILIIMFIVLMISLLVAALR